MLLYRDRLYAVKDGGILTCYRPGTGEVVYRERLGAGGLYTASPVAADGRIYLCSAKGEVTVVAAGDAFRVLARNRVDGEVHATPALVGRRLYLRTVTHLHAFEAGID
jgi:outer membrane protein assembly factor BamB